MDRGLIVWIGGWMLGGFLATASAVYGTTGNLTAAAIAGAGAAGTYLLGKLQESPLARRYGGGAQGIGPS